LHFRQCSLRNFRKNKNKFSRKCENENFRFNPRYLFCPETLHSCGQIKLLFYIKLTLKKKLRRESRNLSRYHKYLQDFCQYCTVDHWSYVEEYIVFTLLTVFLAYSLPFLLSTPSLPHRSTPADNINQPARFYSSRWEH
jgi:hypothetical protein